MPVWVCLTGAPGAATTILDPLRSIGLGHVWSIATHRKDMSPDEMQRAMEETMKKEAKQKT